MKMSLLTFGDFMADPVTGQMMSQAERHHMIIDGAVAAEAAGFWGANIGEHHAGEFVLASPPVVLSAIAARTKTLRLGTAVALVANMDPVRLAEDYSTLDVISGGRTELVVGRGNLFPSTYHLFGQSVDDSRELFEENIKLVLRLWSEENVSFAGKFRPAFEGVTLQPRPLQYPHPPLWIGGGGSVETSELAAKLGLPIALPSAFSDPRRFQPVVDTYREQFAKYGHKHEPSVAACWHGNVGRVSQDVKRRWEPRYRKYMEWFGALVHRENASFKSPNFDYDWLLSDGPAVAGSPDEVAERLGRFSSMLSADVNLLYLDMGGMPRQELLEMIQLFGEEVIPALGISARAVPALV